MGSFLDKYRDISLALSLRDAEPKVSPSQPHAEIRMTPIKTQDYIQIKLATFQYKIFASTDPLVEKNSELGLFFLDQTKKPILEIHT